MKRVVHGPAPETLSRHQVDCLHVVGPGQRAYGQSGGDGLRDQSLRFCRCDATRERERGEYRVTFSEAMGRAERLMRCACELGQREERSLWFAS